jgi:hypothetical protein
MEKSKTPILIVAILLVGALTVFGFARTASLEGKINELITQLENQPEPEPAIQPEEPEAQDSVVIQEVQISDEQLEALKADILASLENEVDAAVAKRTDEIARSSGGGAGLEGLSDEQVENLQKMADDPQKALRDMGRQFGQRFADDATKQVLSQMTEELGLLPAQEEEVGKILKATTSDMMDIWMKFGELSREEMRDQTRDLMTKADEDVKKLLDASQTEKYEKMKADGNFNMGRGFGGRGGGGWGGRRGGGDGGNGGQQQY